MEREGSGSGVAGFEGREGDGTAAAKPDTRKGRRESVEEKWDVREGDEDEVEGGEQTPSLPLDVDEGAEEDVEQQH